MTTIINTHTHGDHVSGNVEFPATVDIVVQENTKANMEKMAHLQAEQRPAGCQADLQGQDDDRQGADQIDLYYFGRGHTNGDAWVVFPALRVVHAGDIFAGKSLPLLDANNGGSGLHYRRHADEGATTASRTSTRSSPATAPR